ncbi:universal stress protein [Acidovorax sp.]|jgi:nucleotide-binding universal stress UspA family protein|uniref:universal stress protein n=1 Tax=Acidovorax sp. TaxID=1872122 RepID=UPI0025BBF0DB|nr:universal stress protein [Acidovorax sp.]
MYEKILVPFDGSPTSEQALKEAAGLALKMGAQVRLLHIIDPLTHAVGLCAQRCTKATFSPPP